MYQEFVRKQDLSNNILKGREDQKHDIKFKNMDMKQHNLERSTDNRNPVELSSNVDKEKWFHNLTNCNIPDEVIEVVSLGPKFSHSSRLDHNTMVETIKNTGNLLGTSEFDEQLASSILSTVVNN
ncbi:hypothetical protein QAD02_013227 [Eretmocerus hayati]|uniref:Uncharacterized protein n=1 Tax=Eretmocerus hayati TaxID=131215 RepID=A0ACC2P1H9_9HYME|nr:hypothetical protein QAD02_013227 [Eretmocerus hayati]